MRFNWFVIFGLGLDIFGALILIRKPAWRYFSGYVLKSQKAREEIEDEAISLTYNRLAGNREENLADPITQGFLSSFKTSFWGFILLGLGFVLQLVGQFF